MGGGRDFFSYRKSGMHDYSCKPGCISFRVMNFYFQRGSPPHLELGYIWARRLDIAKMKVGDLRNPKMHTLFIITFDFGLKVNPLLFKHPLDGFPPTVPP